MSTASESLPGRVAVFGAAGRAGRAITAALLEQGLHVDAVLREPSRHDLPTHARLRVLRGDAQRPDELAESLRGTDAVVLAVTPFTAPPSSFDGFDLDYYAGIVRGVDAVWQRPRRRLVAVGLTATLRLDSGQPVMADPTLFPPGLTPFAEAHARQLPALAGTTLDWAILAPPAGFGAAAEPAGSGAATEPAGSGTVPEPAAGPGYRLVPEPLTREQATARLTHARYARAVAAEVVHPTVHAARVAVVPVVG